MRSNSKITTITEAKKNLLELVEDIQNCHDMVTITKNGLPASIMLNIDDYESLIETLEILADKKIMAGLKKSRLQAKAGKLLTDDEVWD